MATSPHPASSGDAALGLQHTQAWLVLQARLQRLMQCLQSSSHPDEREALKNHFATQLVEQARQYSTSPEPAAAPAGAVMVNGRQATNELNSLALLAAASCFDHLLAPRQQTAPQVRALLSLSGPLAAGKEDAAVHSAWSLFMQQASSTLGVLGAGWTSTGALTTNAQGKSPGLGSPASPPRRAGASESPGTASPVVGKTEAHSEHLPRNTSEIFNFEQ